MNTKHTKMAVLRLWITIAVLQFILKPHVVNSENLKKICSSNDLTALKGFMSGIQSKIDGWTTDSSSSSSSNCCNWVGVTCDSSSLRVVKLELTNKILTGTLSDSLASLDQLRTLNLSHNFLRGSIPISYFQFLHLEVLDLSNNEFSGSFPMTINLPSLQVFNVSHNSFWGLIPAGICANSTRIRVLRLAWNYLNGSVPPELGNCTSMEHLSLASNRLLGNIPEFLVRIPRLAVLCLQDNLFTGQLSTDMGNSTSLSILDMSTNNLFGDLPDVFHTFSSLSEFSIYSNNFSGGIPPSLLSSPTISELNLRNNSFNGSLSVNCSAMVSLVVLHLGRNKFSGSIPDNLPKCPKLECIGLSSNNFTGQIPESFKNFNSVSQILLSDSKLFNLSSSLRILQHCSNLTSLFITMNFCGEEIPSDHILQFKSLNVMVIANCGLTGSIPLWLNGLAQLRLLDLSRNDLTGSIPPFFGNFQHLFYLDLSNNSLSGEIPRNLTWLPSLINRTIPSKQPTDEYHISYLRIKNLSSRGLEYHKILSLPSVLDCSSNLLSGMIWPEFGNMKALQELDLKNNNLSGTIPSALSGMTSIETLDLSHNFLSGTIPPSLMALSFLSKFSVAHNHLSGLIPSGGQFPTFVNSSFEGNPGLCGAFFSSLVIPEPPPMSAPMNREDFIFRTPVGVGFASGLFLAVMMWFVLPATKERMNILLRKCICGKSHITK